MSSRTQYILLLCAAAGAGLLLYFINPTEQVLIPCLFHKVTGLQCAGCGMTRATHFALHAEWQEALRYNPLVFIIIPAFAYSLLARGLQLYQSRTLPRLQNSAALKYLSLGVVLIFMIARNLIH